MNLLLFGSTVHDFWSAGNQFSSSCKIFIFSTHFVAPWILQPRAAALLATPPPLPAIQRHIQSESGLLTLLLSESHKTTNSREFAFLLLDFHSGNSADVSYAVFVSHPFYNSSRSHSS
jgi:hypothetical protein